MLCIEQALIGDVLSLKFPDKEILGKDFAFKIPSWWFWEKKVSLGNIVALAGDFYANWNFLGDAEQISDKWDKDQEASIALFKTVAWKLAYDTPGYLSAVLKVMASQMDAIKKAVEEDKDPAQVRIYSLLSIYSATGSLLWALWMSDI